MFCSHTSAFNPPDVISVLIYSLCAKAELVREDVPLLVSLGTPGHIAWSNKHLQRCETGATCSHFKVNHMSEPRIHNMQSNVVLSL